MQILIVDAQGGGIGKQLVSAVKQAAPSAEVTAVGANSAATAAMMKAGADHVATGENAVVVACRKADIIMGPVGIVAGPFIGAVAGEMLNQKRTLDEAVKVGFGSFLSFIVGTGVKVVVATMITYYIARDLFQQVVAMF